MSSSLLSAVAQYRLPYPTLRRQYGCFLNLSNRLLGLVPSFSSYAHLSPLTIKFYFATLATCLRVPLCDFGLRTIRPRHRRLATIQSSLSHQCRYCIAHTCLLGDLISGSQIDQIAKAGGWRSFSGTVTEEDAVLLQLVKEACAFPAAIRPETRDRFYQVYGTDAYDDVTSIVSFMGWLNYMMLSLGMQIESKVAPSASLILNSVDASMKLDDAVADDGGQKEGVELLRWITSGKRTSIIHRAMQHLRSACKLLSLIPSVLTALRKEAQMFRGIPKTLTELDLYMYMHMGYNPAFIRNVTDDPLKRVLVFGAREVLINDAQTSWRRTERLLLFYAFAKHVQNSNVAEDVLQLLHILHSDRCVEFPPGWNVVADSLAELREQIDVHYEVELAKKDADSEFSAAFRYVCAGSRPGNPIDDKVKAELVEYVKEPRSLVDVPGMIAYFGFVHRVSVFTTGR